MLNQVIIVGRLVSTPEIKKSENGKEYGSLTVAVPRSFKNADGTYDTDFIDCVLWGSIADNIKEYCRKGDIIGIKGRLQTKTLEDETKVTEIVAEKVTFLSSKKDVANDEE